MFKMCNKCKQIKELSTINFPKRTANSDGFDSICKQCKKITDKARYDAKRAEILEQKKDYYKRNRKKIIEKQLKYYRENIERCQQTEHNWRKNNPIKRRNINERRRTRELDNKSTLTSRQWNNTLKYFDFECAYCGIGQEQHMKTVGERLHQEHVVPLVRGGGYTKKNIIPSCRSCNSKKGNYEFNYWYKKSSMFSETRYRKILEFLK